VQLSDNWSTIRPVWISKRDQLCGKEGEGVEKNMGTADRVIRTIIALVILALYINGSLSGALGIILLIIAAIFIATSIVGFCPAYTLFNFSTRKK
jgi:hypothetical protein